MASGLYGVGVKHLIMGDMAWKASAGDTFRAALLLDTGYTAPTWDTDEFVSVIGTNRANATASDVADAALTLTDPTLDTAADYVEVDSSSSPLTYAGIDTSQSVRAILIFKFVTNDADSLCLSYNQFASDLVCNGSDVEVTFNAEGLFTISYSDA